MRSSRGPSGGGWEQDFREGERAVPPGVLHAWRNPSEKEQLRIVSKVRPALPMEALLEVGFGLARDLKTERKNVPKRLLRMIVLANEAKHEFSTRPGCPDRSRWAVWDEIVKHLPSIESAVLTGLDGEGYPYSVRCPPYTDPVRRVLRSRLPAGIPVRPGPASLLCHNHDENMWNLQSLLVRGDLRRDARGWSLRPRRFVRGGPGSGVRGAWCAFSPDRAETPDAS